MNKCKDCDFFHNVERGHGECHRKAPTTCCNPVRAVWPPVYANFGCGDWAERVESAVDMLGDG